MYFIASFGLLMMCLSIIMIVNPNYCSAGIIEFSRKKYFHGFEIASRLSAGLIFVFYKESARHSDLIVGIGYLLILVGLGLMLIGSNKYRKFATWSANKFKRTFRPAGFCSFIFGGFLIYTSTIIELS